MSITKQLTKEQMTITTFGNPTTHHFSIDGKVFGPFKTKLEMVLESHKEGIFYERMTSKALTSEIPKSYYKSWSIK